MINLPEPSAIGGRTFFVVALISLTGMVALVTLATELSWLIDEPTSPMALLLWMMLNLTLFGTQFVGGIAWCAWVVWMRRTLHSIDLQCDTPTSRDLVIWWFVPGLNLIRPYKATVGLWRACERLEGVESAGSREPRLFVTWWVLWVAHQAAIAIGVTLSSVVQLEASLRGQILGVSCLLRDLTLLAAVPLALAVVWKMNRSFGRAPRGARDARTSADRSRHDR